MTTTAIPRDALNAINAKRPHAQQPSLNTARASDLLAKTFDLNTARTPRTQSASTATPTSFRAAMDAISTAKKAASTEPESEEDAKLRTTAETLVNQLFMGTMLKQMRSSPFKDDTMSGGKAGDAYAGLFDQNLAAKAGGGMGKGLVDVMVKHLKGNRGESTPADLTNAQAEYRRNQRKPGKEQLNVATAVNRAA